MRGAEEEVEGQDSIVSYFDLHLGMGIVSVCGC